MRLAAPPHSESVTVRVCVCWGVLLWGRCWKCDRKGGALHCISLLVGIVPDDRIKCPSRDVTHVYHVDYIEAGHTICKTRLVQVAASDTSACIRSMPQPHLCCTWQGNVCGCVHSPGTLAACVGAAWAAVCSQASAADILDIHDLYTNTYVSAWQQQNNRRLQEPTGQ